MTRPKPSESFVPSPHANAGANAILAERLRRMSPEALRSSLIDAGVPLVHEHSERLKNGKRK